MTITGIIPQLRTTDIAASIDFYTRVLGFAVEFNYEDFYVSLRAGEQLVHLKRVDEKDPSIAYVEHGGHLHLYLQTEGVAEAATRLKSLGVPLVEDVHETPWGTREVVLHDDQGHTLYLGEPL
jgi:catechol 2,3-dioxygenase-like lactoylglutathione lyase family enzyme